MFPKRCGYLKWDQFMQLFYEVFINVIPDTNLLAMALALPVDGRDDVHQNYNKCFMKLTTSEILLV